MSATTAVAASAILERAKQLSSGITAPQAEFVAIANALMDRKKWMDASLMWRCARTPAAIDRDPRIDVLSIAQEAQCISKERSVRTLEQAFTSAVKVLTSGGLDTSTDQETLGIAGGIYKRYWEAFRQTQDLQQALAYYHRGWQAGGVRDDGYTGINAAYVEDVLAHLEEASARRGGARATASEQRRRAAQEYRRAIVSAQSELEARIAEMLAPSPSTPSNHPWWILATLAEAHFGLAQDNSAHYVLAEKYLQRAMELTNVADWMIETTARQLGAMARMQEAAQPAEAGADARPWRVLDVLVRKIPALRTELGGKVGLALSGGGFRASLFHIGVLARLAELDMLRHVEVISCVSGGSILGAAYYLELRKLLETKRDEDISHKDYLDLVRRLEVGFLEKIQKNNFRMRMVERFSANLKMLKNKASRTEALGRVMGRELYGSDTTRMDEITIQPRDGEQGLAPVDYNWRRKNKVPLLVLNATNQAGGHPWHFTPYEMGEPQLSAVDANPRMARRPYASDNRAPHMWRAVSASACVPVLFEPIRVSFNAEPVHLLDGGVHDNQGTSALLAHDCTLLLVSDASGQLSNDANASTSFAAVGLRADGIVQERLRIALYEALEARRRGSLLRGMMFLHLRLGLGEAETSKTPYGISSGIQRRISAIRTDLDVFNDAEALSLMVSGYHMAKQQFSQQLPDLKTSNPDPAEPEPRWEFRQFEQRVLATPAPARLETLLDLSGERMLKAWRAVPALKWTGRALLAIAALVAVWQLIVLLQSNKVIAVSWIASTVLTGLAMMGLERLVRVKAPNWKKEAAFAATALTGAALAKLHAKWLDPAYLRAGQRDRVL